MVLYKRSSKPVMKGSRVETIETARTKVRHCGLYL